MTPQGLTVQRGTHESGQDKESEGPLEMVSAAIGAASCFALGNGDKRENGDRFQSQSRFLEIQDLCVDRRSRISGEDAIEPGAAEQSDAPCGRA